MKKLDAENEVELYAAVGEGQTTGRDVLEPFIQVLSGVTTKKTSSRSKKPDRNKVSHAIPIKGLIPGMAMHFAKCCHPLPGDRIVGIVSTGRASLSIRSIARRWKPEHRNVGSICRSGNRRTSSSTRTDTHDFIQHAGQPWHVVYRHRAGRRQYLQSEGNKSFCRLFRIIGRYRSYGRKTIDRYYRRLACEFGHSCGRTSARLGVARGISMDEGVISDWAST